MERVIRTFQLDGDEEIDMVAVQYWKPSPVVFRHPSGRHYDFVVQHNVSLAWMSEDDAVHAMMIMEKHCKCAGGTMRNSFLYASQAAVSVFEKGRY